MQKIRIGLYGFNGHQIHGQLENHPHAVLVATAAFDRSMLPEGLKTNLNIRHYTTLDELARDKEVQLVSLCSPKRCEQAKDIIKCLNAGKHVYAEKPSAMSEHDLDEIIAVCQKTGNQFHEMAGTAFAQPYLTMRKVVIEGTIGTVVQVYAQKSYPYHDERPQNENADGGLICQCAVHALRFIEHVACVKIETIKAVETKLSNPKKGNLQMASSMIMNLVNGGVASVVANYLNPKGFGKWGNESLRIFGTNGFIETVDGGAKTRLVLNDHDRGNLDISEPSQSYLDMYLKMLLGNGEMPISMEDELHPTRMAIRAKASVLH